MSENSSYTYWLWDKYIGVGDKYDFIECYTLWWEYIGNRGTNKFMFKNH